MCYVSCLEITSNYSKLFAHVTSGRGVVVDLRRRGGPSVRGDETGTLGDYLKG